MRRNIHNMHKRRGVIVLLLFMIMSLTMKAQVFMLDGDENYRTPEDPQVFVSMPDGYGLGVDYYLPVGDGVLLFIALGGAYLMKREIENNKNKNNKTL